jgi:hypothetical protein
VTNTKGYDGNTSAAATPTVSGLQGTDTVTGLAETYDNKNKGTGKTLSVSAYTVNDGNSGNNYDVHTFTNLTGVITQRAITVTAVTSTKAYDGNIIVRNSDRHQRQHRQRRYWELYADLRHSVGGHC